MIASIVVIILALFMQVHESHESEVNFEDCSSYINNFTQYRALRTIVPSTRLPALDGKYCGHSERTCCTQEVEASLKEMSKNDYEKAIQKALNEHVKMFKSSATRFNEYFKEMLDKSKRDFDEMFKKTYGMVYEQNSYVFSDFFDELERYYFNGKSNLADVMDTFFNILYQKMFTVMNSQFRFDEKYLGCVSEHMNDLKPFGDVPQKISMPLRRSFVASRIYAQSLSIVGDVVANLMNMVPNENCYNAITKMSHCSVCKNHPGAKICPGFCINVMKGCFALHSELDTEWNAFVDSLSQVQGRLLGSFSVELVVEPINVKISEAIMNFQEQSGPVSNKVFNGCGRPPLLDSRRRRRREANSQKKDDQRNDVRNNNEDSEDNNERRRNNKNRSNANSAKGKRKGGKGDNNSNPYKSKEVARFHKFITEVGELVSDMRFFWKRLPDTVCRDDDMNVEKNRNSYCWNGQSMGKYVVPEAEGGLKNQQVPTDTKRPSTTIEEQLFTLRTVTTQLKTAFNGEDVEWIDNEETFDSGSGSGMYPDSDGFGSINPTEGSGFEPSSKPETSISEDNTDVFEKISSTTGYDLSPNHTDLIPSVENTSTETASVPAVSPTDSTTIDTIFNVNGTTRTNGTTSDGSTIRFEKMSLNQAVATYLLPTVVVWMGGSFNEWFHTFVCNFQF